MNSFFFQNDGFYLLPYFGLWFLVMASGGAADRLQSHGVLNTATTRKIMQIIGECWKLQKRHRASSYDVDSKFPSMLLLFVMTKLTLYGCSFEMLYTKSFFQYL